MRIVCLSDTHNMHDRIKVPDGDVLVHAGDFTGRGRSNEVKQFGAFLATLPHEHKVVIAGNHDFLFQDNPVEARDLLGDVIFLQDSGVHLGGLNFWGSPWQPWFHDWAFNLQRGSAIAEKWALIPDSVDVLVTHGPASNVLDMTMRREPVGCHELTKALHRVSPYLHVFGHIHEAYGTHKTERLLSVNASNCTLQYAPSNKPVVVDWDGKTMQVVDDEPS